MKYAASFIVLFGVITAVAFAASNNDAEKNVDESLIVGRFIISDKVGAEPTLLDTATGNMWTLQESTNLTEVRMVAWVPMERLRSADDVARWQLTANAKYERHLEFIKSEAIVALAKKAKELGPDHPDVLKLAKEISDCELYAEVTDEELGKARQSQ